MVRIFWVKPPLLFAKRSAPFGQKVRTFYAIGADIVQVEHSRHKCFDNSTANLLGGIAAYCPFPKKPCINVQRTVETRLTLFWIRRTHVMLYTLITFPIRIYCIPVVNTLIRVFVNTLIWVFVNTLVWVFTDTLI